jgi:pimeloyl-ACP methyl ester carboxylesterase
VAQELALARPDLVDRLVLVCTSYGGRGPQTMSPGALADMMGLGTFSAESAARKALEAATGEAYRAEKPEEFEQIVRWRLADSPRSSPATSRPRRGPGSTSRGTSGT